MAVFCGTINQTMTAGSLHELSIPQNHRLIVYSLACPFLFSSAGTTKSPSRFTPFPSYVTKTLYKRSVLIGINNMQGWAAGLDASVNTDDVIQLEPTTIYKSKRKKNEGRWKKKQSPSRPARICWTRHPFSFWRPDKMSRNENEKSFQSEYH